MTAQDVLSQHTDRQLAQLVRQLADRITDTAEQLPDSQIPEEVELPPEQALMITAAGGVLADLAHEQGYQELGVVLEDSDGGEWLLQLRHQAG